VRTDVQEGLDASILLPPDDDFVFTHFGGDEITNFRDLALVSPEKPASLENALELALVDLGVRKKSSGFASLSWRQRNP
jgi:hypothetical protein